MILLLYAAFPLCIPEHFAKLQLLDQLLCTASLKKLWSRGTVSHVLLVQARPGHCLSLQWCRSCRIISHNQGREREHLNFHYLWATERFKPQDF